MGGRWTSSVLSPLAKDRLGDIYLDVTRNIAKLPNSTNSQEHKQLTKQDPSHLNHFRTILTSHDASSMIR